MIATGVEIYKQEDTFDGKWEVTDILLFTQFVMIIVGVIGAAYSSFLYYNIVPLVHEE